MTYQFKIQLIDVDNPRVWRRITVPGQYDFFSFHAAIKAAFGWENEMWIRFSPEGNSSQPVIIEGLFNEEAGALKAGVTLLSDVFTSAKQTYLYQNSRGIKWLHHIELEEILDHDAQKSDCLDGEGYCPPAHCLGADEYRKVKEIMEDENHPERAETIDWMELDEMWSPCNFSLMAAKERVLRVYAGPEYFRNYRVEDYSVSDEKYGLTPEIWDMIDKKNKEVSTGKVNVSELKYLAEKYCNIPHFRNMLAVYYFHQKRDFKRFMKISLQVFKDFPDYVLARCNIVSYYVFTRQLDKVPDYFGYELDLCELYPERKGSFTDTEIFNFHQHACLYLIAKEDALEAQRHLSYIEHFYPDSPAINDMEIRLKSLRLFKMSEAFQNEINVKVVPQRVAPTKLAPVFNHPEVEIFYRTSYNINRDTLRQIIALPRKTLVEDMEKMLMDCMARHKYFSSMEWEEDIHSFPIHALYVLSSLRAHEALDALFALMRQTEKFYEFWLGDVPTEEFWHFLYLMAQNSLERLKDFILEPNCYEYSRTAVSEAIMQIFLHQPDRKQEVCQWYTDVLREMLNRKKDRKIFDDSVFSSLTTNLIMTGGRKEYPLIKECVDTGRISHMYLADYPNIKASLAGEKDLNFDKHAVFSDIEQFYDNWEKNYGETEDDEFDDEFDDEPEFDIPVNNKNNVGRNDPCPCGSGKKYKKCCM